MWNPHLEGLVVVEHRWENIALANTRHWTCNFKWLIVLAIPPWATPNVKINTCMNHNQWQTNTTKIIGNTKSQYMHIHGHKHTRRHIQGLQPGPAGHEHTNTSWPTWPLRQGARVPDLSCSGSEPKVPERLCLCTVTCILIGMDMGKVCTSWSSGGPYRQNQK